MLAKVRVVDGDGRQLAATAPDFASSSPASLQDDCFTRARAEVPDLPASMPPVKFPKLLDCERKPEGAFTPDYSVEAMSAWIVAHHNAWRAYQMVEITDYDEGRFERIRTGVASPWKQLRTAQTADGVFDFKLRCPDPGYNNGGNAILMQGSCLQQQGS